jgi:DNA-binding transcriptional LysR family regulator
MTMNFRQLDLNLLRVLDAIYRTGSVTEAGRRLALSQPAVSHGLRHLREALDDALFVRTPAGLRPTRRAQHVAPAVAAHLRALEAALAPDARFDPASGRAHWRLSMSDLGEILFLPPLATALRREAPHTGVANAGVPAPQVGAALASGEVDLAIGILGTSQAGIAGERLFHERFVAITASDWRPSSGRVRDTLSARQLAAAWLAVASPTATYHESVQHMLDRHGLGDRIAVHARHYAALPDLVTATDLLAIVPQMYARALGGRWRVRVWELPGHRPDYDVSMLWHASATGDPAHAWLRALVRRLFARAGSAPLASPHGARFWQDARAAADAPRPSFHDDEVPMGNRDKQRKEPKKPKQPKKP